MADMDCNSEYCNLLKRHRPMMRRMCWVSARGNTEHCRDLEQEVSIALWLHFDKLRPDASPQEEKAWVRWTTRSTLDHLNRRQRPPLVELTETMSATISDTGDTSASEEIEELMAALNPEEQRLLQLYIEGYCGEEIAATMGIKRDAVYQRMHRAVSRVRRAIVLILLVVVASALAVAVVPQLREWVFPRLSKDNPPLEVPVRQDVRPSPVVDTVPEVAAEAKVRHHKTVPILPMPPLFELPDTSKPVLSAVTTVPCGCSDKQVHRYVWEECDTIDDETETMPDVTITTNGNVIMVEGANNETVSVYDGQGRLVATTRCYGYCTLTVTRDSPSVSSTNPAPYWVQVGSRPREQVFLQFPAFKAFPIILY